MVGGASRGACTSLAAAGGGTARVMAREYARIADYYHYLQPPPQHHYYPIQHLGGEGSAAAAYEVSQTQHDPRKRKNAQYEGSDTGSGYETSGGGGAGSGCGTPLSAPPLPPPATRKRKSSSYGTGSAYDDDGEESYTRQHPDKKQNHSEIEKRRRDKMNTYISELSAMVPMCGAMARKLDKLTVLRMAVQHMRVVRGSITASPLCARARPSFLSERALNALVLQAARDTFVLVVGCDRGRILYVSDSVSRMLAYQQAELLGQSLFDILHPKDVSKVKEQLSSSDLSPRERLIDAKTMLPVKADITAGASRLSPGARRSFFARIKCKVSADATTPEPVKEEDPVKLRKKPHEKKYCVVQCTGYLKSWSPTEVLEGGANGGGGESGEEGETCNLSCLVAVARALPDLAPGANAGGPTVSLNPPGSNPPARRLQFVSRHAIDGKFLFVDQRVTLALGWLPQELLGTSLYELVEDGCAVGAVARAHKAALLQRAPATTPPYALRTKDGGTKHVHTHFKPFRNPWTRDVECLVANNTLVGEAPPPSPDTSTHPYELFKQPGGVECEDAEMRRLIESHVESHKIGSAIAEEALRRVSPEFPADFSADLHDAVFSHQPSQMDNILGVEANGYNQVRNNVPLSVAAGASPPTQPAATAGAPHTPPPASPPLPLDGNGEAAMAVIMSLLEADAGLGGAVNFNDLTLP